MDSAFFDVDAPDITSILTAHTQLVQAGTSEKVGLFIQSMSYFVAAFVVGFILNAELTGILFAAIIPTMVIIVITGTTFVSKLSKTASVVSDKATEIAESAITSVEVVQAFGIIDLLSEKHVNLLEKAARVGTKKSFSAAIMLGLVYFTCYAANALAFYQGSRLDSGGAGTIYAIVFLILDASFVVGQFGPFIQTFAHAASAGSRIFDLLDRPQPDIDVYSSEGQPCSKARFEQDISFNEVHFSYPARRTVPVLDGVELRFPQGSTTGIVGLSGSGKSTIASLLVRLYDPIAGSIMVGDVDIKDFHLSTYRSHISLVDQDPVLFTGTVLSNVKDGIPNIEDFSKEQVLEKCQRAVDQANAGFVQELPYGINTEINNTSLSGGQRQRLCLARALVREPSLLILDEPTSALDATSERLIIEALKRVSKTGCTIIMIAHRLATIKDADKIIVMGSGNFLEEGTHDELVQRDGAYRALVNAQNIGKHDENGPQAQKTTTSVPERSESNSSSEEIEKEKVPEYEESKPNEKSVNNASYSIYQLIKRCLTIDSSKKPLVILGVIASIMSGGIVLGESIIFGHLVNLLNTVHDIQVRNSQVDFFCLMFFVISLIAVLAYSTSGSAFGLVSESLVLKVRDKSLRTILRQDVEWFSMPGHSPHSLMASMNSETGHLAGLSGVIIGTILSVSTSVIGGIILAHIVAWKIAIVLLSAVPVMVLAGFFRLRVLDRVEQRHATAYNDAAAMASEACRKFRTVAAFGREPAILLEYQTQVAQIYNESFKLTLAGNLMLAFSLAITYFVYALAYYWGSRQVRDGDYSEEDFFIVLPALLFSAQAAGQMFNLAPEITRAKSAARNVFALHDTKPTILSEEDASKPLVDDNSHEKDAVVFNAVSLAYPSRPEVMALNGVNLKIKRGEFIGIVGPSGAGKTSFIALLERFYDVTDGAIEVNGLDIRKMPVTQHRQRIGLVSQDCDLFPGSIMFNIRLGARSDVDVTDEKIMKVCKQCGIHDFIMSLPEAYNTECGQNGSQLSGGQKQRLAVARALIRDPDVLLLDEATSALDAHSEHEVQQAIAVASDNRTTIVVAHRLASVQKADRIFVLDQGQIAEEGTHQSLRDKGGIYAGLAQAQVLSGAT